MLKSNDDDYIKFIIDSYLKNLPIPLLNKINTTTHNPLNKLSHLLQTGTDTLSSFRPICNTDNATHTDPIGEESNETADKVTSGIRSSSLS